MKTTSSTSQSPSNILHLQPKEAGYVKIPQAIWKYPSLRGGDPLSVLLYLLCRPPHWKLRFKHLAKALRCGECKIRSSVTELRATGFCLLRAVKNEKAGKFCDFVYSVADTPIFYDHPENVDIRKKLGKKHLQLAEKFLQLSDSSMTCPKAAANQLLKNPERSKDGGSKDGGELENASPDGSTFSSSSATRFAASAPASPRSGSLPRSGRRRSSSNAAGADVLPVAGAPGAAPAAPPASPVRAAAPPEPGSLALPREQPSQSPQKPVEADQPSTSLQKQQGRPTLAQIKASKFQMPSLENYPEEVESFVRVWDDYHQIVFKTRFWWTDSELEAVVELLVREEGRSPEDVALLAAQAWILKNEHPTEETFNPHWACNRYSRKPSQLMHVPRDQNSPMVDRIKIELGWAYTKLQLRTIREKLELWRQRLAEQAVSGS